MSDSLLNVLIVGCGNIAGGFDTAADPNELPCTHAGAYRRDGRFNITACVEPDDAKRNLFMRTWEIPEGFQNIEEAKSSGLKIDIASICSPTRFHKDNVLAAIELQPKLIFCEKPVSESLEDTHSLISACDDANILLAINHTRRWDPEIQKLKQQLSNEDYGELRSVTGYYNKGILNNGSHLIDLLCYLLGDLHVLATAPGYADYSELDPSIPALLQSQNGVPIHLVTGHAEDYALFELQLISTNGVLLMRDGGMSWLNRRPTESIRFSGYRVIDSGTEYSGGYKQAMLNAVDDLYHAVHKGTIPASNGNSAYTAQKICAQILQSQNILQSTKDI